MEEFKKGQSFECVGEVVKAIDAYSKAYSIYSALQPNQGNPHIYYEIMRAYAYALDSASEIKLQAELYDKMNSLNKNGPHIGDYAIFLHKKKKDYARADEFFSKAVALFPSQSSVLFKYAGFVRHIQKDNGRAKELYFAAVEANPNNVDALGGYASFLHGVEQNYDLSEVYYKKAIETDDSHINNLCNYSLFLSEHRASYALAEEYFKRILLICPDHANSMYNYAVMLDTRCNRKEEAEILYREVVRVHTTHTYAMYNLSQLLENKMKADEKANKIEAISEITKLYSALIRIDDQDAVVYSDFGRFLLLHSEQLTLAERYLLRAAHIDRTNEVALYFLGLLYIKYAPDIAKSETHLRMLIDINPNHGGGIRLLAEVLQSKPGSASAAMAEQVMEMWERAAIASTSAHEANAILSAYVAFTIKTKLAQLKNRATAFMDTLTTSNDSTTAGVFSLHKDDVSNFIAKLSS